MCDIFDMITINRKTDNPYELAELVRMFVHDVNNLLSGSNGYISMLSTYAQTHAPLAPFITLFEGVKEQQTETWERVRGKMPALRVRETEHDTPEERALKQATLFGDLEVCLANIQCVTYGSSAKPRLLSFIEDARKNHYPTDTRLERYCTHIRTASGHEVALLKTIDELTNQETGPYNLNEVVRRGIEVYTPKFENMRVTVQEELASTMPNNYGSQGMLLRIFYNLATNAIQALQENPANQERIIRFRTISQDEERNTQLIIEDTGPGVLEEHRIHLFRKRYTTKGEGGNGLGLYGSREIASRHDGSLVLDTSYTPGARFVLTLPVRQ